MSQGNFARAVWVLVLMLAVACGGMQTGGGGGKRRPRGGGGDGDRPRGARPADRDRDLDRFQPRFEDLRQENAELKRQLRDAILFNQNIRDNGFDPFSVGIADPDLNSQLHFRDNRGHLVTPFDRGDFSQFNNQQFHQPAVTQPHSDGDFVELPVLETSFKVDRGVASQPTHGPRSSGKILRPRTR